MAEDLTRRRVLQIAAFTPVALSLAACGSEEDTASAGEPAALAKTPACGEDPTPEQTEGPYYTPRTPARRSLLEPGLAGSPLVVTGRVLDERCRPVAGALLDFWQADGNGEYDLEGFIGRGNQRTDRQGRYRLTTVRPGEYPGRTPHIHVKVAPPRGSTLTTQLYFPGEDGNASDGIFDEALLVTRRGRGRTAFDFVV